MPRRSFAGRLVRTTVIVLFGSTAMGCAAGSVGPASAIIAGSSAAPREVNLIARDYAFVPGEIELIPGETILLHVINGGIVVHEAVIGGAGVQDAWENAEAAVAGGPPGPTPVVTVPAGQEGVRIVVASGERVDVTWTVPSDTRDSGSWSVGCHIPGHLSKGMQVPVRWLSAQSPADGAIPAP